MKETTKGATPEVTKEEVLTVAKAEAPKPVSKVELKNRSKSPIYLVLKDGSSIHLLPTAFTIVDDTVLELPQVKFFVDNRDIMIKKVN